MDPGCDGLKVDVVPPAPVAETLQCLVYISPTRKGNVGTKYRLGRMGREAPDDVDRRSGAAMGEREVPAVNSRQIIQYGRRISLLSHVFDDDGTYAARVLGLSLRTYTCVQMSLFGIFSTSIDFTFA